MGILHFAGLGKSPGAVTAGLAYLMHEVGNNPEQGDIIEGVVIFTSREIISGTEPAYPGTAHNEYMKRTSQKTWTKGMQNSLEIVSEYLYREVASDLFYVCEVNVNNFESCFNAVAKTILKFHSPGKVGKHIWVNITGGSNVLNAALIQTAYLSGLIPSLYYTFVANLKDDGKYLQPFSRDKKEFDYRKIYVIKTTFDERYQYIFEELAEAEQNIPGGWISSEKLRSRLKAKAPMLFENLTLDVLKRDFLNTMHGVARKGTRIERQEDLNRLNEDGKAILSLLKSDLFKVLLRQNTLTDKEIKTLTSDLNIKQLERKTR